MSKISAKRATWEISRKKEKEQVKNLLDSGNGSAKGREKEIVWFI